MKAFLILLSCVSIFAQRTPLRVNNQVVNNPNFTNSASVTWSLNGVNVSATATGGDTIWTNNSGNISAIGDGIVGAQIGMVDSVFWGTPSVYLSVGYPTVNLSTLAATSAFLFGFGEAVLDASTFSDSYHIYGIGNYALEGAVFSAANDVYAIGQSELNGINLQSGSASIFAFGVSDLANAALTNINNVAFVGAQNGSNLEAAQSTYLYAIGRGNFSNADVTNFSSQLFAFGNNIFSQAVLDQVSDSFGIGTTPFTQLTASGSSALYAIGNTALQASVVQNSSDVYSLGDGNLNTSVLTNTFRVFAIGDEALKDSRLTNSSKIYAFGFHTGNGLVATGLIDVMLFGDTALPSQSHQMTFNVDGASSGSPYRFQNSGTSLFEIGFDGALNLTKTITPAGTTGAQTIDKVSGRVNFAAAAQTLVVTDSLCTVNSVILATVATDDATAESCKAIPGNGSFTLKLNAAATAETAVNWLLTN